MKVTGDNRVPTTVPENTTLADLDDTIRALLKRELSHHRLDAEIAFDAPNKEWSAALSTPTINAFLYDLSASKDHTPVEWGIEKGRNGTRESRPPLMLETSYAFSVWTRSVEDEHRLLSQVLAILNAFPRLPEDVLAGNLVDQPYPLTTSLGQPRSDGKADFWSSVGGSYKASLDYTVTLACASGTTLDRGPEVRTQTVRVGPSDAAQGNVIELHRAGGIIRSPDGEPVANAWIALTDAGRWTATTPEGRFRFDRLAAGTYECLVRTPAGQEGRGELTVPGRGAEISISGQRPRTRPKR